MKGKYLHIISFNVPYPANYGGVIDVFYKLKALATIGVKIILHTFEYGRPEAEELNALCDKVYYYHRPTNIFHQFSFLPFIVKTRNENKLLQNIIKDNHPILFEGLHTCYFLDNKALKNRKKIIRMHNIEWQYYAHLAKMENNFIKKIYFKLESLKLKSFEKKLKFANSILTISKLDTLYFQTNYPNISTHYIPAFHVNENVESKEGKGNYFLFHGDLSVKDNEESVLYILKNLTQQPDYQWIIAGLNPTLKLQSKISDYPNITLKANLSHQEMKDLIKNAHANVLLSFQSAGMKLKLINALYKGRFCVVNNFMVKSTGLEELCFIGNSPSELMDILKNINGQAFTKKEIEKRKMMLLEDFSNKKSATDLISKVLPEF